MYTLESITIARIERYVHSSPIITATVSPINYYIFTRNAAKISFLLFYISFADFHSLYPTQLVTHSFNPHKSQCCIETCFNLELLDFHQSTSVRLNVWNQGFTIFPVPAALNIPNTTPVSQNPRQQVKAPLRSVFPRKCVLVDWIPTPVRCYIILVH